MFSSTYTACRDSSDKTTANKTDGKSNTVKTKRKNLTGTSVSEYAVLLSLETWTFLWSSYEKFPLIPEVSKKGHILKVNGENKGIDIRFAEVQPALAALKSHYSKVDTLFVDSTTLCTPEIAEFIKTVQKDRVFVRLSGEDLSKNTCLETIKANDLYVELVEDPTDAVIIALSKIPSLRGLSVSGSHLTNKSVDAISKLVDLKYLKIHNIQKANLDGLLNLTNLETLALPSSTISEGLMKNLGKLRNISALDLSRSKSRIVAPELKKLEKLERLNLKYTDFSGEHVESIANLRNLKFLNIGYTQEFRDKAAEKLTTLKLEELDIEGTGVTEFGLDEIKSIKTLRALNIGYLALSPEIMGYLTKLPNLEVLGLASSNLQSKALSRLSKLKNLRMLDLASSQVDDSVFSAISILPKLEMLNIDKSKVSARGFTLISNLKNLKVLSFMDSTLPVGAFRHIGGLEKLRVLKIGGERIDDNIFESLAGLKSLKNLRIKSTKITGSNLSNIAHLQKLTVLDLSGAPLTDTAVSEIARFASLEQLYILDTQITCGGLRVVYKERPRLKVFGVNCSADEVTGTKKDKTDGLEKPDVR